MSREKYRIIEGEGQLTLDSKVYEVRYRIDTYQNYLGRNQDVRGLMEMRRGSLTTLSGDPFPFSVGDVSMRPRGILEFPDGERWSISLDLPAWGEITEISIDTFSRA